MASARAPTRPQSALVVDVALLAVVLMWASVFVLFKVAWRDVDPVAFTGVRFAVMVILAALLLIAGGGRRLPRREDIPSLVASSLCGYFLYQMGFVLGLDRTTALASAILISTHPLFAVVFSWIGGVERPTRREIVGVAIGFLGVGVFLRFWDAFAAARLGDLLSLGAAAAFGAYGVLSPPLAKRYSTRELMAFGLAIGGTLVALVSVPAMARQDWGAVSGASWLILGYSIIGPVYIAYALWNWAIGRRGIAKTVVYAFLVPVVGGALAVVALNESFRPEEVVGAVMVVGGLAVTRLAGHERPSEVATGEARAELDPAGYHSPAPDR